MDANGVSFDDGRTWVPADLGDDMGPWAWRVWRARGTVDAGDVAVLCRATDGSGATQPPSVEHTWNPKGYVNNAWHRVVVRAG